MQPESWQRHAFGRSAVVKRRENTPQPRHMLRRNSLRTSVDKQSFQTLMPEASDHSNL